MKTTTNYHFNITPVTQNDIEKVMGSEEAYYKAMQDLSAIKNRVRSDSKSPTNVDNILDTDIFEFKEFLESVLRELIAYSKINFISCTYHGSGHKLVSLLESFYELFNIVNKEYKERKSQAKRICDMYVIGGTNSDSFKIDDYSEVSQLPKALKMIDYFETKEEAEKFRNRIIEDNSVLDESLRYNHYYILSTRLKIIDV